MIVIKVTTQALPKVIDEQPNPDYLFDTSLFELAYNNSEDCLVDKYSHVYFVLLPTTTVHEMYLILNEFSSKGFTASVLDIERKELASTFQQTINTNLKHEDLVIVRYTVKPIARGPQIAVYHDNKASFDELRDLIAKKHNCGTDFIKIEHIYR